MRDLRTIKNCWQSLKSRRNQSNHLAQHNSSRLRTVAAAGAALLVGAVPRSAPTSALWSALTSTFCWASCSLERP